MPTFIPSEQLDPKTPMASQEKAQNTHIGVAPVQSPIHLAISGWFSCRTISGNRMGRPQMPTIVLISALARGLSEGAKVGWRDSTSLTLGRSEPLDPWFHFRASAEIRKLTPAPAKPEPAWPKGSQFPQWRPLPHLQFPPHPIPPPQSPLREAPCSPALRAHSPAAWIAGPGQGTGTWEEQGARAPATAARHAVRPARSCSWEPTSSRRSSARG